MSEPKQEPKHHCDVCRQIEEGCQEDARNPQDCKLCGNNGFIGNPRRGPIVTCSACGKGLRLRLWIAHEKREGHHVPECVVE